MEIESSGLCAMKGWHKPSSPRARARKNDELFFRAQLPPLIDLALVRGKYQVPNLPTVTIANALTYFHLLLIIPVTKQRRVLRYLPISHRLTPTKRTSLHATRKSWIAFSIRCSCTHPRCHWENPLATPGRRASRVLNRHPANSSTIFIHYTNRK